MRYVLVLYCNLIIMVIKEEGSDQSWLKWILWLQQLQVIRKRKAAKMMIEKMGRYMNVDFVPSNSASHRLLGDT
jgi:hypothetical protein